MTAVRLRLKLRAVGFGYTIYTWAGVGRSVLFIIDSLTVLSTLDARNYITHAGGSLSGTSTKITTDVIIYPGYFKPIQIIDGIVKGQLAYKYRVVNNNGDSGKLWITKIVIRMFKVDSDNNETEFKNYTITPDANTTEQTLQDISFLYFFQVENEKITITDRILVKIETWMKMTDIVGSPTYEMYVMATPNTDERSIDIPIV